VDSERDESSVAEIRRMITGMFKELKRGQQSNKMNPKRTWINK
jgi:hypothetical protein